MKLERSDEIGTCGKCLFLKQIIRNGFSDFRKYDYLLIKLNVDFLEKLQYARSSADHANNIHIHVP